MERYNAQKIMMDIDYKEPIYYLDHIENDLYKFQMRSDYLNSVQPSIWRTDYLKSVLKEWYTPWQFEVEGNSFTKSLNPLILLKAREKHMYFNMVRIGGRYSEGYSEFLVKEGLSL
jgi:hypothetical protein